MTAQSSTPKPRRPTFWLMNQPYLLLSLTSLFWAGNTVVGRLAAGHIPPMALSLLRWIGAFLIILPFAWNHLVKDWPLIRKHFGLMLVLSFTGVTAYNTIGYWALQYTEALNALLLQSMAPLFVALFSLLLFGIRLTWMQAFGIIVSLIGVVFILTRGEPMMLRTIEFNKGDIGFLIALLVIGVYSALAAKRPAIHPLSFLTFTCGCGSLFIVPFFVWEIETGRFMIFNMPTLAVLAYVVVFPSTLAYLFFNRGVELIGANRASPFFHLIPVFGSVMAIGFLGERLQIFHLAGYALVLAGVIIAARSASAKQDIYPEP